MKKRIFGVLMAVTIAVLSLSGCGGGDTSQNGGGGSQPGQEATSGDKTVVIGIATDLKTLDPGRMYEVFGNMITYATYDMLFRIEGDDMANPKPSLVTEWTLDPETSTVYTFQLRDNVQFQSGNPMTSKDVAWSINRVRNLKSNTVAHVEGISDIQTPDDKTVVITLKAPDASFLTKLASNAFCILDSELVKQNGGTDAPDASSTDTAQQYLDQNSAGSGPYRLVSWTPNVEVVLEKNPNYWGEVGNIEKYIIKEIPDTNTQIQMLEKNEIDIAFTLNADNVAQLENKEGIEVMRGQSSVSTFLLMNEDEAIGGPVSNPDVQQAIRYAIDYQGLRQLSGEGATFPLSFVPLGFVGAETKPDNYQNLEEAKKLMEQAGYGDGFDITLTAANFDTEGLSWVTIAQKIQSDLAELKINVKVETTEVGVAIDQYREGKAPFLVMHWSPDYFDINNQLVFLPGDTVGQRANWLADANPAMTELGAKIIGESNVDTRAEYSKQLQEMMAQDSPYAFLLQHPKNFAVSSRLDNVVYNDLCKLQLSEMNVK